MMLEKRRNGAAGGALRERMQAGLQALQAGDAVTARDAFTAILEANPRLAMAHVGLGRVYSMEGDHRRALEHYQEALAIQPDLAPAQLFIAQAHEKLGDTEEALSEYEGAVALDSSMGLGYVRRAQLLAKEDRNDEALDLLREAVAHSPQEVGLRVMLAGALLKAEALGEAEAELVRATELKSDLWVAHYQLGKVRLRRGDPSGARAPLARAVALSPEQPAVHQALGAALAAMGEHAKAARSFDEAYRLKPSNVRVAVKAAQARAGAGRPEDGVALLVNLGRIARRSNVVQKALGDIYLQMGRGAEAVECFRAMILNAPKLRESSPEVAALAEAPEGSDPLDLAKRLQSAIGARSEALVDTLRSDPGRARSLLAARRERRAG